MKSPHLWLAAASMIAGLSSGIRADASSPSADPAAHVLHQPTAASSHRWFRPVRDLNTVFRAQSDDGAPVPPEAGGVPSAGGTVDFPSDPAAGAAGQPALSMPDSTTWNAFSPPMTSDPFLNGGTVTPYAPVAPGYAPGYGAPAGPPPGVGFTTPGANGGRPYRFGVEQRLDLTLLPAASVKGGGATGKYEEFGVDYDLAFTRPFVPGWIVRETGQFRSRTWDGPAGAGAGLPGSAFHLGLDFEFATPQAGPYSISLGVTPSINTDFNSSATSTAWQFDGRGIIWWKCSPGWSFGLGAMYWDRVEDRVIPYGGWVYRDDFWEWRLMLPESEVRLFIGNEPWWSKWLYLRARYNVEAFEITTAGGVRDEVEFEDWQLTCGFQMDAGYYRWFIEGGVIIDREINYGISPDVGVETSYITRIGWRY